MQCHFGRPWEFMLQVPQGDSSESFEQSVLSLNTLIEMYRIRIRIRKVFIRSSQKVDTQ